MAERERRSTAATRARCKSFHQFVIEAWPVLEPRTEFVDGPHLHAICQHLEAVSHGQITRLLINVPPGAMKSLLVSVFWPAYEWGPLERPHLRYVSTAFAETAVKRDTRRMRDLVMSDWYQKHWPHVVLTRTGETSFANKATGWREGSPFGSLTSKRGNRLIVDDPHSVEQAESDLERLKATRRFREGATNRLNDQRRDAIIVIMQRLHSLDISGYIIANRGDYVHLMLPMEFEADRACSTVIGFKDWRTEDGELLCRERWSDDELKEFHSMGQYAYAGQYQQRPAPREGGMFKRAWFEREGGIVELKDLPPDLQPVRHWDLAATQLKVTDTKGARTAGVKLAKARDGRLFVLDCIARGIEGRAVEQLILNTARDVDGPFCQISLPQDPGQAGKTQKFRYLELLEGFDVRILAESGGDKPQRAVPFAAQCEGGNVYLLRGPWIDEFLDELCLFPGGARKDIADACSGAYARVLKNKRGGVDDFDSAGLAGGVGAPRIFTKERDADLVALGYYDS
jgi:predicted phage terminase large subunit-like protein